MIRALASLMLIAAGCYVQPAPAAPTGPQPVYQGGPEGGDPVESEGGGATTGEISGNASCSGGEQCNWECPEGGCNFACAGGSSCNIDCEGGGCNLSCAGGAVCNFDCQGGGCNHACAAGSDCNVD